MSISDLEQEYIRIHSEYLRLVDRNAPENDIKVARTKLDELGDKINEEYRKINKSCTELMSRKIKSFYISKDGDTEEIRKFTDFWTQKIDIDNFLKDDEIRFFNITIFPIDLEDIMRSLLSFKTIKLTKVEFKD